MRGAFARNRYILELTLTTLFILQNYQKTYVGISANSIRCIWEQYDSNETDINVDILPVLAEDASYRLWELGNVSLMHNSLQSAITNNSISLFCRI